MPWCVRYYDRDFNLEENFDPNVVEEIERSIVDRRDLLRSFDIVFHGEDIIYDITFSESADPNELPYHATHGSHLQRFDEVYIFHAIRDGKIPNLLVLYENSNEEEAIYNEVRFPLAVTRQ
ncbi:hypothetical protein AB4Y96_13025 [Phyllobacterium sp. TAF24]|uniref:hypothetical protein n=1 Tax=Phyllobacterium sp. TAF24 TaxID=3233068 RepID=UPI003F9C3EBE